MMMKRYWIYYGIGLVAMFHPHLAQKFSMLLDYFIHPEYEFWSTFNKMDLFDLLLHAALPALFIGLGIRNQFFSK